MEREALENVLYMVVQCVVYELPGADSYAQAAGKCDNPKNIVKYDKNCSFLYWESIDFIFSLNDRRTIKGWYQKVVSNFKQLVS